MWIRTHASHGRLRYTSSGGSRLGDLGGCLSEHTGSGLVVSQLGGFEGTGGICVLKVGDESSPEAGASKDLGVSLLVDSSTRTEAVGYVCHKPAQGGG